MFPAVRTFSRWRRLLTAHTDALRAAFRSVHNRRPFRIDAIVILPNHLHCIWTLPPDDADFSTRWRVIKSSFSRAMAPGGGYHPEGGRNTNGAFGKRDSGSTRRDQRDFDAYLDYIHVNPVKDEWVSRVADWPHSSLHRFVRSGWYPLEWAAPADVRGWDLG